MIDQVEGIVAGVPFREVLGMEGGRGRDLIKRVSFTDQLVV